MFSFRTMLVAACLTAASTVSVSCSSPADSPSSHTQEKTPVRVGQTRYHGQLIPVFDGLTVKCEKSVGPVYPVDLKREGMAGEAVIMIVVDENGIPVEFGTVSSTPDPRFALAALAAARQWRYFPMTDATGKAFVHALRMPLHFKVVID